MKVTTLCLGALVFGDATGYEINKMFEDGPFSHFLDASYGSIYPALTRLTEKGLVTCRQEPQDGRPDKKVYSLTESGRQTLREALEMPLAPDKFRSEFLFAVLFADLLPESRIRALIDERLAVLRHGAEQLSVPDSDDTPGVDFARRYGLAVFEASIAFLESNRHLIEKTLNVETHTHA